MEQNPYEVLNVDPAPLGDAEKSPSWFSIEGDLLVCGRFLILPEICVFTGATEDLVVRNVDIQYSFFRLVIIRRQCRIQYCLTWAEDWKRRRISYVTTGGIVLGFVLMIASIPTEMIVLVAIGAILSLFSGVVKLILNPFIGLNLCIARFEAPGTYKIRGFSVPFLATLAATVRSLDP